MRNTTTASNNPNGINPDYCSRLIAARGVISRPLDKLLRILHCGRGFVDEDPLSLIAGADMAILDASKAFGLGFVALSRHQQLPVHFPKAP